MFGPGVTARPSESAAKTKRVSGEGMGQSGRPPSETPQPQPFPASRERENGRDRKSTRLNSSHANISYAVFCLKKKKNCSPLCPQPSIPLHSPSHSNFHHHPLHPHLRLTSLIPSTPLSHYFYLPA